MFSRPAVPGYDSEARIRERQPPMMRRPDALDLAQARNDAEIASLEAAKRRAEEAEREAAEARARAEAALALAMANSGWSLAALQDRIDQVIDATVHQSIARGSAAIEKDLLRVHKTYVNVEARRAHSYGPEIKKKTKEEVNSRFFTACLVEIKRRDGDQTVAREELTKTALFDAVIKSLMGTKISVFGSTVKKAFVTQIVVDAVKFASDIIKGNHTVLHAPTQCGKTSCAGLAACVGKLKKGPTVIVVAASVSSVNQMAKDKMPDIVGDFGVDVVRLTAKVLHDMDEEMSADIVTGRKAVIAHWNALELVEELIEDLVITEMNLVLDESDDLITNVEGEDRTAKEASLARIFETGAVDAVTSLSATQLGWLRFVVANGIKVDSYLTPDAAALRKLKYRGLEGIEILKVANNAPVWIPDAPKKPVRRDFEDDEAFKTAKAEAKAADQFSAGNAYGIKSPEIKQLFDKFNASKTKHRVMFLSLGGKVVDGFVPQAHHVLTTLSPDAKVFMLSGDGVTEFGVRADGDIWSDRVKNNGRNATISYALARDADPKTKKVIISQGCSKRGQSLCALIGKAMVSINFMAIYATDGFNLADLQQLFGRCTGRMFKGMVTSLLRKADYEAVMLLDEFTKLAVEANMRGEDIMRCDALADPKFAPMLEMVRPFNRKRVLKDMPDNERAMRVKRQRLAVPDPGAAGPSNRGGEQDPTYVPRRLRGWECVLLALHGTLCYTAGESMPVSSIEELSMPILRANNIEYNHGRFVSDLKRMGFIENIHGFVKMTVTGKAACDEIHSHA